MFKISLLSAVSAFALAAVLLSISGCTGHGTVPSALPMGLSSGNTSNVTTLEGHVRQRTLGNEFLIANKASCVNRKFKASGKATGLYTGSFSATGDLDGKSGGYALRTELTERFTITSHSSTFSGTVKGGVGSSKCKAQAREPDTLLRWSSAGSTGYAEVTIYPRAFRETLDQF